jgi:pyrroline-5-carboxylate reductase
MFAEKLHPAGGISVFDINKERLSLFKEKFNVTPTTSLAEAAKGADLVLFAIKPQNMSKVFQNLKGRVPPEAVLLSIVAGVPISEFLKNLGDLAVVRSMPNTPATIREVRE